MFRTVGGLTPLVPANSRSSVDDAGPRLEAGSVDNRGLCRIRCRRRSEAGDRLPGAANRVLPPQRCEVRRAYHFGSQGPGRRVLELRQPLQPGWCRSTAFRHQARPGRGDVGPTVRTADAEKLKRGSTAICRRTRSIRRPSTATRATSTRSRRTPSAAAPSTSSSSGSTASTGRPPRPRRSPRRGGCTSRGKVRV